MVGSGVDAQFVPRGSLGAFRDAAQRDAVKAFISALLTRAQHEERQKLLLDIERLSETSSQGVRVQKRPHRRGNCTLFFCMPCDNNLVRHKQNQAVSETRVVSSTLR